MAAAPPLASPPAPLYLIKPATLRDVHTIRRLELITFPKDAYSYLNLSSLLMWPGGAHFKVVASHPAEHEDVVGFVSATPDWGRQFDWIVTLGVHPSHQNRGLGRRLLVAAEAAMTQPHIRLTVRTSNVSAIHLYESAGYVRSYIEPRYYSDGEDGIVMEKTRTTT
jgi:ribosomal-protein-alanine N-acetyltransferase